ncbi:hypothetical protein [Bradyrhizobium sp. 141]|uniref:hypothetical protein n=1 Tax=Bradyrhizobium sp. 141 TaxID=2782617 RepID=UPI001FFAEB26|nr:hypothetical protein [Bradyrhizobium sp. 141]
MSGEQPAHRSVDCQIAPAEEVRPAKHLCVVDHDNVVAMEHRAGIGQTDQAAARSGARQIDLVPGMPAQAADGANLDSLEVKVFACIHGRQQLPVCVPQRGGRLLRRQLRVDRLDDFCGITLNAGEFLRQKAAVDEEFQLATRIVLGDPGRVSEKAGGGRIAKEQPLGTKI